MGHEPMSILDATNRIMKILDSKYEKADLKAAVQDNHKHLDAPDQAKLLVLLIESEFFMEH
jgi:hypothetical protein